MDHWDSIFSMGRKRFQCTTCFFGTDDQLELLTHWNHARYALRLFVNGLNIAYAAGWYVCMSCPPRDRKRMTLEGVESHIQVGHPQITDLRHVHQRLEAQCASLPPIPMAGCVQNAPRPSVDQTPFRTSTQLLASVPLTGAGVTPSRSSSATLGRPKRLVPAYVPPRMPSRPPLRSPGSIKTTNHCAPQVPSPPTTVSTNGSGPASAPGAPGSTASSCVGSPLTFFDIIECEFCPSPVSSLDLRYSCSSPASSLELESSIGSP